MDKKESVAPASATQTKTVEGSLNGVLNTPTHKSFSKQNPKESVSPQVGEKKLNLRKTIEIQIPKQHMILSLLCDHVVVDSKGYICCIHNLEVPCYCTPENCRLLKLVRFF